MRCEFEYRGRRYYIESPENKCNCVAIGDETVLVGWIVPKTFDEPSRIVVLGSIGNFWHYEDGVKKKFESCYDVPMARQIPAIA